MCTNISEVYLSSDYQKSDNVDQKVSLTDVIVELKNGERHIASFFTYDYVEQWKVKHKDSKEFFYGKYFWVPNMIIVDNCAKENIIKTVQHLIDEGDFRWVFKLITK